MLRYVNATYHAGVVYAKENDGAADEIGPITLQHWFCTVNTVNLKQMQNVRILNMYVITLVFNICLMC